MIGNGAHAHAPGDEAMIAIEDVTRRFGAKLALDRVSLTIPRGVVLGLVGENGAGKTTLIRHMLGLLKAATGSVRVFGLDPVTHPVEVLGRMGYLSEDRDLPGWMRVDELIRYTRAFYSRWDDAFAEELRRSFQLDRTARIRDLSQGQRARAGLLVSLAHRPDLLVLDEPSTGLDPIVRRDILAAIIRTIADEGRTVVFSSHLLDEVERVSDRIAMLDRGTLVLSGALDEIKEEHRRVTLRFDDPQESPPELGGALALTGTGREWTALCRASLDSIYGEAGALGARVVAEAIPTLDEIFVARVGGRHLEPVEV
jgi:ABC-2 type transport system ATP-binding protein